MFCCVTPALLARPCCQTRGVVGVGRVCSVLKLLHTYSVPAPFGAVCGEEGHGLAVFLKKRPISPISSDRVLSEVARLLSIFFRRMYCCSLCCLVSLPRPEFWTNGVTSLPRPTTNTKISSATAGGRTVPFLLPFVYQTAAAAVVPATSLLHIDGRDHLGAHKLTRISLVLE